MSAKPLVRLRANVQHYLDTPLMSLITAVLEGIVAVAFVGGIIALAIAGAVAVAGYP